MRILTFAYSTTLYRTSSRSYAGVFWENYHASL